jgi:hypothetical protein
MSDTKKDVIFEAHIHAFEKRERNGKWKTRGLDVLADKTPEPLNNIDFRYKHLISGEGDSFEAASADAWQKLSASSSLRSYMLHAIRAV